MLVTDPFGKPSGLDEDRGARDAASGRLPASAEASDRPRSSDGAGAEPPVSTGLFVRPPDLGSMRDAAGRSPGLRRSAPAGCAAAEDWLSLIDFALLDDIFDNFLEVTGLPIAVLDLEGRVLASSKWQRLCAEFHRANKITSAGCLNSDTVLSRQLQDDSDCAVYQCANGLTDCATPIVIEGRRVANLFTGQFLQAAADVDRFKRQQESCGFDEKPYFRALAEVPIVAADKIPAVLRLLRGLAQQIASLCLAEGRARQALGAVERQVDDRTRRLAESEDRFRAMFEGSPVGQLLIDPDGLRILECNQAAADIQGCSREDLRGVSIAAFDCGQGEEAIRGIAERLAKEGHAQFETCVRRRDGELRDIAVTVVAFRAAEGYRFHGTHVDISERKRAEREQRRLERALRLLGDCNLSMVEVEEEAALLADVCRLVVATGGYRMAWIGVPEYGADRAVRPVAQAGDAEGYLNDIRITWDETSPSGCGPTGTAIRTGVTQVNQTGFANPVMDPWRSASGARGYRSSIALQLISKQQALGVLTVYAAEADAFNASEVALLEELARNLAFGIETLRARRQRDAAENASRAKSSFLANMSHEIRTPLHAIIGLAYLLRRDIADAVPHERLDQLCASSDHLLAIINNVLDLSKIEADRLVLEHQPFTVDAVIDRVVGTLDGRAREKGLLLTTELSPGLAGTTLAGDALRLAQVLINLCGNAVKFTPRGKVQLGVAVLAEDDASATLSFAVEDTGIGIAPADQARLFRPFEQADESATREYQGTGLGLAISQRLVAMMGGRIEVDSQVGRGSRFTFKLAFPRATGSAVEAAPAGAPRALGGKRVLLAEDNQLSQEVMLEMLEDLGCDVDVAGDGVEAVDCARQHRYDLILMDMQMPRLDGLAATRAIRALPGCDRLPIIALTANAFVDDRRRCLEAGMNGHIGKPVDPGQLAAALGQWLSDVVMPKGDAPLCDTDASRALADIAGLTVGKVWRTSEQRLRAYCAQLGRFVTMHQDDLKDLRRCLTSGDRDGAHAIAHRLKGIAGLIGAWRVESLAGEIVFGLRNGMDIAALDRLAIDCDFELASLADSVGRLPIACGSAVDLAQAGPT